LGAINPLLQIRGKGSSDQSRLNFELSSHNSPQDKAVQLFQAFAPMLCKRPTKKIEDTVKEMGGAEFIIEEKLDGERMQLHKRGNEYFYCSRYFSSNTI
jgi:DNA ligase-4